MVTITIKTDNAAFADFATLELGRILSELAGKAHRAEDLNQLDALALMDYNGNKVGQVSVK